LDNTTLVAELNQLFKKYHTARQPWYQRGIENEEMVYSDRNGTGTQFTTAQLSKVEQTRTIPITVNILSAIKEQIQAFLTGFKPALNCVPVGASSKKFAYVWREVCLCLWSVNKVSRELDAVISDSLVAGNGYLRARPNNFYVSNDFNVVIEYVPWQYVYLDPDSKRQDLKDHECIIIASPSTINKAKKIYGFTDEEVAQCNQEMNDTVTIPIADNTVLVGNDDKPVWVQEFFRKEKHTIYYLEDGRKTLEKPTDENTSVAPDGTLQANKVIGEQPDVFIRYILKVGSFIKVSQLMPCTNYPIVKFGCKWNKKPYDYPVMHDVIDLQKAFNSFLAITILNAQVASNAGWVGPTGSTDKAQFAKDASTPGGYAEYEPDPALPDGGRPQQRMPQPLSNAWYTLMNQIIYFVEYVTGIYGVIQGNPQNAPNTLGATNSLQDLGTQRVKRHARFIDYSLDDLFDTVIEFTQHYGKQNAIASYINNTDAATQIRLNAEGQVNEQGQFQEGQGQEKAAVIENLVTGEINAILGDYKAGQYYTRFQNASDLPSTRAMALGIVKELMAHMSDPAIAVSVAEQALDLLDMPQADMILDKVNLVNKMQGQIGQLTEQVQKLAKENESLTEEVFDREKELKLLQFDKDLNKVKVKVEMATKETEDKQKEVEQAQKKKQTIYK